MTLVLPAEQADLERIAEIQLAAFQGSIINQRIFGNVEPADHRAQTVRRLTKALVEPANALYKAVVGGHLVGFALWELPKHADEQKEKDPNRWPVGTNVALAEGFFGKLDLGVTEPHYHLSLLATDPAYQRTGAGSALLRWGCMRADDQGVDCYLEASAVGISVYRRAQFDTFGDPIVAKDDPDLILYPMRRPALTLSSANAADLPHLAPIQRLAFGPTRINQYCYADVPPAAYEAHFTKRFGKFLDQRDNEGARFLVSVVKRGGKYLAFAFSSFEPDVKDRPADSGEKRFWPDGANVRRAEEYLAGVLDRHKKENLPFAHWSLSILSVTPEAQGQGIGRRLVQEVLDIAKRDGVPVTLESTEFGRPLYEKTGFVEFGEILRAKEDDTVELWPMIYKHPQQ